MTADDLDAVNVGFAFGDGAGASAVKEARYRVQDGTGRLNLYLAGNDNLFEGDALALGRVTAVPADGSDGARSRSAASPRCRPTVPTVRCGSPWPWPPTACRW
ncbi:hypothetical protein [Eggerthella sinensis]|uniref:hypothetical protein n=1 Tax=Eggerthella sinensis TaxID=242230 RepID=UPI0022E3FB15|nr:hypothetical protein [Eggerthella sinensis]